MEIKRPDHNLICAGRTCLYDGASVAVWTVHRSTPQKTFATQI